MYSLSANNASDNSDFSSIGGDSAATTKRERWNSYSGFVFASIGAAVGIGNIWRFPYIVGKWRRCFLFNVYNCTFYFWFILYDARVCSWKILQDLSYGKYEKNTREI
jgi:NSS family neurotransmitter:Na+ symporter